MRKNLLTGVSTLMAIIAAMTGCKGNGSAASGAADTTATSKVLVRTMAASLEDVDNIGEFMSNIQAFKENNIAPSMPVRIDMILVDVGSNVKKGAVLARMDPTQYNTANVQLTNTLADYNRSKAVYDAGGISRSQIDAMETQVSVLQEQVNNLKDNIELLSPIDGVVTARNYDPGDLYNGATPVLQVMQISPLKVTVAISEQFFPLVKMNMPAAIHVDMYPDKVFDGKVSLIYPAIDASTRTFTVEISIPNPNYELRPGMFSRTTLNFGTAKGVMVEDIAVQKQMGTNENFLFVAKEGKAERRVVTTGRQIGARINITSGVAEGEQVIVAGMSRLMDGTEIEVKND